MTRRCRHYERIQHARRTGEPVDEAALQAHVAACEDCAAEADRWAAYEALLGGARQALESRTRRPLPEPAAGRVRRGRAPGSLLRTPLGVAAAAFAVGVGLWLAIVRIPDTAQELPSRTSADRAAEPAAPAGGSTPEHTPARADGGASKVSPRQGTVLAADEGKPLRRVAFGRHVVTLGPGSRAVVRAWRPERIVVDLLRGRVDCDVAPLRPDAHFAVRSGDLEARVVGTRFRVERRGKADASVTVREGMVRVEGADGLAHRVPAGGRVRPSTGARAVPRRSAAESSEAAQAAPERPDPSEDAPRAAPTASDEDDEPARGRPSSATEAPSAGSPDEGAAATGADELDGTPPPSPGGRTQPLEIIEIEVPDQKAPTNPRDEQKRAPRGEEGDRSDRDR